MSGRDAFDAILAALHEAAHDDARWPEASALIDEACGIKGNMLVCGSGGLHDKFVIRLARLCYRGERNEALERRYLEEYFAQDERVARLRTLPDSRVVHVSDLYTEEEKKTSSAYNEAMPLLHMQNSLNVRMDGPDGTCIVWSFADPVEGDGWSFGQNGMIERLLPHLRQYVRTRQVLAGMDVLKASLSTLLEYSATGVIQLNRRGRIMTANARARDILQTREGLFDRGGFLYALASADNGKLQELLARASPVSGGRGVAGSMAVAGRSGWARQVLHVIPVGDGEGGFAPWNVVVMALVVDPYNQLPVDRALVEAALDLSPAESRVAVLLAEGKTVHDVAVATGRSVHTIRWHIRQIFEKQDMTRIGQLVPLVRSLAGHSGTGT